MQIDWERLKQTVDVKTFWLDCPKYHLWGIFPTQFLLKNTNFKSELKNIETYGF